jgi:hypothetical protein
MNLSFGTLAKRFKKQAVPAEPSMSRIGNCYDNAKAEAFFSTLKTESFPVSKIFQKPRPAPRSSNTSRCTTTTDVFIARWLIKARASMSRLTNKTKKTVFSKETVITLCAEAGAKVKRANEINGGEARRQAPFMSACDLNRNVNFSSQCIGISSNF